MLILKLIVSLHLAFVNAQGDLSKMGILKKKNPFFGLSLNHEEK